MTSIRSHIQALKSFIERSGAQVSHVSLPQSVNGRIFGDVITLRGGLSPSQELAALVHEAAHWLAHRGAHSLMDCTVFEYEAEAVEVVVLSRLGLTARSSGPSAGDATDDLLASSVERVLYVSDRICGALGVKNADRHPLPGSGP